MGRTVRDPQDLDINDDMDEFDNLDDPSSPVEDKFQLVRSSSKRSKGKGTQQTTKKLRNSISTESDDWQDPQDDIMYGFCD
ncbi:MAG: hypothetical protein ACI9UN_002876 [Granulosicoccus sp.]|jgi:hypothetical protein